MVVRGCPLRETNERHPAVLADPASGAGKESPLAAPTIRTTYSERPSAIPIEAMPTGTRKKLDLDLDRAFRQTTMINKSPRNNITDPRRMNQRRTTNASVRCDRDSILDEERPNALPSRLDSAETQPDVFARARPTGRSPAATQRVKKHRRLHRHSVCGTCFPHRVLVRFWPVWMGTPSQVRLWADFLRLIVQLDALEK